MKGYPKFGIGAVSKNTVDAVIDYSNESGQPILLIPSRRQVEWSGGYCNNWTTKDFAEYVRSKSKNVILERDHGTINQGSLPDNGLESLKHDCNHFGLIHIDPWKAARDFSDGMVRTRGYIEYCHGLNPDIEFEVGTEESIFPYGCVELDNFLSYLKSSVSSRLFNKIKYAVIQSGTKLSGNDNTGEYQEAKLLGMIEICKRYGILSREHNGDYLPIELIHQKFKLGLNSINIAPEFGQLESQIYIYETKNAGIFHDLFEICLESGKWQKWVPSSFNPQEQPEKLVEICGHYVLSNPKFLSAVKSRLSSDIDKVIKDIMIEKLRQLHG